MPKRKRVYCMGHGPMQNYPQAVVPWEDVWIKFAGKPDHRKTYRYGPTLQSRAELIVDLEIEEKLQAKYADSDDPELRGVWDASVVLLRQMLADLDRDGISGQFDSKNPSIYTSARWIDRREAERMLTWWLWLKHGIANQKFIWKRSKYCVMPMALGDYSESATSVAAVDPHDGSTTG